MSYYIITCTYCGFKEKCYLYSPEGVTPCSKCKDKNTTKEHIDDVKSNPFGYENS